MLNISDYNYKSKINILEGKLEIAAKGVKSLATAAKLFRTKSLIHIYDGKGATNEKMLRQLPPMGTIAIKTLARALCLR